MEGATDVRSGCLLDVYRLQRTRVGTRSLADGRIVLDTAPRPLCAHRLI
jgi:hypothetical protein